MDINDNYYNETYINTISGNVSTISGRLNNLTNNISVISNNVNITGNLNFSLLQVLKLQSKFSNAVVCQPYINQML